MGGMFITFEGPECCGKTVQLNLLQKRLEAEGFEVVRTKEPGGSHAGPAIRKILLSPDSVLTPVQELLLFYSDRNGNIHQVIKPALARGAIVLSDRFADSTRAYQHYGRGVPMELIDAIHDVAVADFQPDLTILYDIDVEEIARRVAKRQGVDEVAVREARFDNERGEFHERIRGGYAQMAAQEPGRFVLLDGMQSIEALHEQTYEVIKRHLTKSAGAEVACEEEGM